MRMLKNMKEKIMILLIVSVILCICITAVFVVSECYSNSGNGKFSKYYKGG